MSSDRRDVSHVNVLLVRNSVDWAKISLRRTRHRLRSRLTLELEDIRVTWLVDRVAGS